MSKKLKPAQTTLTDWPVERILSGFKSWLICSIIIWSNWVNNLEISRKLAEFNNYSLKISYLEIEVSCLANQWTLNETMVFKNYKFYHSCIALSFYVTILEWGTPSHFKMPRNRNRECPACFKQVRSDVLKTHCKIKHGMSDDQIDALKNYSCKYCKKHFSRSINCRYHELHC